MGWDLLVIDMRHAITAALGSLLIIEFVLLLHD